MRIIFNKKGSETGPNEITGLLIGAVAVGILIVLFFKIVFPNVNISKETSEAYIDTLKEEIKKVDLGEVGTFEMIDLKEENIFNRVESFLIYFGNKIGHTVSGEYFHPVLDRKVLVSKTFLSPDITKSHLICVCTINKDDASCDIGGCFNLDYPAQLKDSKEEKWFVDEGVKLKISLVDDGKNKKYVFEKYVSA